jgi:hypothetical protein
MRGTIDESVSPYVAILCHIDRMSQGSYDSKHEDRILYRSGGRCHRRNAG